MSDHEKRIAELEEQMNRLVNVVVARQRSTDEAIQILQRNTIGLATSFRGLEEAFKAISSDTELPDDRNFCRDN